MNCKLFFIAIIFPCIAFSAKAATSNGNDFALYYSEAKTPAAKKPLVDDALGRPHFFRYLKIIEMQESTGEGNSGIKITAVEPSSNLNVKFTVTLPVSLSLLRDNPASKVGDTIAVTGKVSAVDAEKNAILLDNPIIRFKDRPSPKKGQELISEVDPTAVVYSYTEGPRPVQVEKRDEDLLQFRDRILAEKGPKGWCEFLEIEIAKRKQQRAAASAKGGAKP